MPTLFITGTARGIGRAAAERMLDRGWTVLAGVRRQGSAPAGTTEIVLDVADDGSVAAAGAVVEREVGPAGLDAVVNNAGIAVSGPIEALSLDDLRKQLEVNVVGQVAVTQAVLPAIRRAGGRVVLMSSVSGFTTQPFLGAYGASKHAIEAVGDALRLELEEWKLPVILVEPTAVDTDIWRGAAQDVEETVARMSPQHQALYGNLIAAARRLTRIVPKQAAPVQQVADVIERALTDPRPRARYRAGRGATVQVTLAKVAPDGVLDGIQRKALGL